MTASATTVATARSTSSDRAYTRDEWLEQVPAFGGNGQLPPDERKSLLTGFVAAVDAMGGRFTMHCTTVVVTGAKTRARRVHSGMSSPG
ncbi:hypothetical protein [Streptomyces sp. NPDC001980]|uniref:hypothetical protein n=1 Tax=Streptomyces sp. NPDC001980 TaxID=3157126 RepID=UPI00331D84AD